jgi:DTW domain-containing protein YfiP
MNTEQRSGATPAIPATLDKAAYLERKRMLREAAVSFKKEQVCYTCRWLRQYCRCPLIKPFDTDIRFVILMHTKEAKQEKLGTGRICKATLRNSQIIVGVDFTLNAEVNAILADPANHCLVLYPGRNSLDISKDDVAPLQERKASGKRLVVFLIDGTWQCAKKMMTLSGNVRNLPRVSFSASHKSIFYIKQQPADYCLSTLESIHFFLGEADRRGLEHLPGRPQDNLITVFQSMIDFMIMCALDPGRSTYRGNKTGYTKPEDRQMRKPASGRNIVLID